MQVMNGMVGPRSPHPPLRVKGTDPMPVRNGYWRAMPMWQDGECFILGGGPSLKAVDVSRLEGRHVIVVNNAYQLAPWADVLFFGDCRWYLWHKDGINGFQGLKVTCCEEHVDKPGVKVLKRRNAPFGISSNPYELFWNLSSGATAVNLAAHFGVRRIVLLGFDMRLVDDRHNWHKDHQITRAGHDPYKRFLIPWPTIAKHALERKIEIVNATPGSGLTLFPILDPETVLPVKAPVEAAP